MRTVRDARKLLKDKSDKNRAGANKEYFRSPFSFLGVTKKDINAIGSKIHRSLGPLERPKLLSVLEEFWSSDVHEEMSLAIVLAALRVKSFKSIDVRNTFSRWLDECETWDHVDELCIRVTGKLVLEDDKLWSTILSWSASARMWKRRSSLISHLPSIRSQCPRLDLLEESCKLLAAEKEFFIRKAIGWVLRELGDNDKNALIDLFSKIGGELSPLSRREATRKLEGALRQQLLNSAY